MSDEDRSLEGMNLIAVAIVVVALVAAWRLGANYGWGYHAIAIPVIFALAAAALRLVSRPLDLKSPEVPEPENDEARQLVRELERNRRDLSRLQRHLTYDAFVVPAALMLPLLVCLVALRDTFYQPESRIWILIGVGISVAILVARVRIYDLIIPPRDQGEPDGPSNAG